jgi:hypothetical protein
MVAFPDVQKKAQAELDNVVGHGKLPTFADYSRGQPKSAYFANGLIPPPKPVRWPSNVNIS